jgi:RHS repeat-associated protein
LIQLMLARLWRTLGSTPLHSRAARLWRALHRGTPIAIVTVMLAPLLLAPGAARAEANQPIWLKDLSCVRTFGSQQPAWRWYAVGTCGSMTPPPGDNFWCGNGSGTCSGSFSTTSVPSCAPGQYLDSTTFACVSQCPDGAPAVGSVCLRAHPDKARGPCKVGQALTSRPCDAGTGNKTLTEVDYVGAGPMPLRFARHYNSVPQRAQQGHPVWTHSYARTIRANATAPVEYADVSYPDGSAASFRWNGSAWQGDGDIADRLERLLDGAGATAGWRLTSAEGDRVETYNATGKLVAIANRAGLTLVLTYSDGTANPPGGQTYEGSSAALPAGLLIRVSDPFGRSLRFGYDGSRRLVRLTDPAGQDIAYTYDPSNNVQSVTYPGSQSRIYHYNEAQYTNGSNLPYALTGITDENGSRLAIVRYDTSARVASSEWAGGAFRSSFAYNADATTTVTDALSTARTYSFTSLWGVRRLAGIAGPACPDCGPTTQLYDANGNIASRTDWNGNRACYKHDPIRNLETIRGEGLTGACPADVGGWTPAAGTVERKITTEWHPTYRLPTRIAEPLRITTDSYDANGNLLARSVQATSDATGAAGFGASPVGSPRVWTYSYNANGQVLVADGPRTDVSDLTTYTYYANDDPDAGKRANVAAVSNALGHVTQISAYNAHGQPLTIVDANGLTTTLAYDARQRLVSRSLGGETTTYAYDGVGQLTRVTLPDGASLAYSYDAAHRLSAIADSLGNRIAYTLDAMGNRVAEQVTDPQGALAQSKTRVYSALNRLQQEIGAQGQSTSYAYDNQGNLTGLTDALGRVTSNTYDALNRLTQMTDPAAGITRYAYDGLDQLSALSDPRNLTTSYTRDGLGNLTSQVSPDTGTSAQTVDAAGNVLTRTDAKGQVLTTTYDALNRATRTVYQAAAGSQVKQVDYGYDACANGVGRLCTLTETGADGSALSRIAYAYDPKGRIVSEARTLAGQTYTTAYAYDGAGRLAGMTYPSGRTLTHSFDALGRVNRIETSGAGTSAVVLQDAAYQPFGPVKAFTFGNLQPYARSFDLDGRIASYTQGPLTKTLAFDAASRIVSLTDSAVSGNTNLYGYDALDRLTQAITPGTSYGYAYDAVGNRTVRSAGSATTNYSYEATANRLTQISGASSQSVISDANGSIIAQGSASYAYDARGRMIGASTAIGTTMYVVNALGQRVRKTSSLADTVFHYDVHGRLIAESTPEGTPVREYVWLADQPVAVAALSQGSEVVVDNTSPGFSATGNWPTSTAVAGYLGTNYQTHEANGTPPGALVVDNTDAGFSVTGTWTASTAISGYYGANYQHHYANGEPPGAIIADNSAASATGTWPTSTSVAGYYGTNYQVHAGGTGANVITWTLSVPSAGSYQAYARWTAHPNRATNAKYTVNHAGGATVVSVNQEAAGGQWVPLGSFSFNAGATTISLSDEANEYVIADAVMLVPSGAAPNTASWALALPAAGSYQVYARWTAHPNRATDAKYTVNHAGGATVVTANQELASGQWNLLGTFNFSAGPASVQLTDQANGYVIADAVMFVPPGAGPSTATWTANVSAAGNYQVYARWTANANRATNATYTVTHAGGATPVVVNQQANGGAWQLLGTYTLSPGAGHKVNLTDQADGYVVADAVRFVPTGAQQSGSALYYVSADHLGTPRAVTNQSQQLVWRWENQEAFGDSQPEENPAGQGTFSFPLRFPGQYFDKETGLHYGGARDYDSGIGAFIQPEPLGLAGDINLYRYARSNPLSFIDPDGKQAIPFPGGGAGAGIGGLGGFRGSNPFSKPKKPTDPLSEALGEGKSTSSSSSSSSGAARARCEAQCDKDYDFGQAQCEAWWKTTGRDPSAYRVCMDRVRAAYIKCYQDCADACK